LFQEPNEKHKGTLWAECGIFLCVNLVVYEVTTEILKVIYSAFFHCHHSG